MARRTPKVVVGAATASDYLGDEKSNPFKTNKPGSGLRPEDLVRGDPVIAGLKKTQIELHSKAGAYVIVLAAAGGPQDAQGKERPLILKFRRGRRVLDLEDLYDKRRWKKVQELAGKGRLQAFGLGREFWNAAEAFEKAQKRQLDQAVETFMKAAPEVKEELLERLGAEYKLPARKKGGSAPEDPENLAEVLE